MRFGAAALVLLSLAAPAAAEGRYDSPAAIEADIAAFGASCIAHDIWWNAYHGVADGWFADPNAEIDARISALAAEQAAWSEREIRMVARLLARYDAAAAPEVFPAEEAGLTVPDTAAGILRLGQSDCQDHERALRRRAALGEGERAPAAAPGRDFRIAVHGAFCLGHVEDPASGIARLLTEQEAWPEEELRAVYDLARARISVAQAEVYRAAGAGIPIPDFAAEIMRAGQADCQDYQAQKIRAGR